jgi:hypothetical protein
MSRTFGISLFLPEAFDVATFALISTGVQEKRKCNMRGIRPKKVRCGALTHRVHLLSARRSGGMKQGNQGVVRPSGKRAAIGVKLADWSDARQCG